MKVTELTYQRNRFLTLVQNFNTALQMQTTETNSAGNAMNRYGTYAESTEAKMNDLKNTVQKLWMDALSSKTINNVISQMTGFVQIIDRIIKGLGGWNIVLIGVVVTSLKFTSVLKDINNATQVTTLAQFIKNIINATTSMIGLTSATKTATLATIGFNAVAMGIPLLIGAIVLGIEAWTNRQQKLKDETEAITKAQTDFNTALRDFETTLDPKKIDNLSASLENLKKATDYDNTVKQIADLKAQIDEIISGAANDSEQSQITLLPKLQEQLKQLEDKIKPVTQAQKEYDEEKKKAITLDYESVQSQVQKIATNLQEINSQNQLIQKYQEVYDKLVQGKQLSQEEIDLNNQLIQQYPQYTKVLNDKTAAVGVDINMLKANMSAQQALAITQLESIKQSAIANETQTKQLISDTKARINAIQSEITALQARAEAYQNQPDFNQAQAEHLAIMNTGRLHDLLNQANQQLAEAQLTENAWKTLSNLNPEDILKHGYNSGGSSPNNGSYFPSGNSSSKSSSSTPSYEDPISAIINSFNLDAKLTSIQNESLKKHIEIYKQAKDYNHELEYTNKLIAGQKTQIDQLTEANKKIDAERQRIKSLGGFDTSNWFDPTGEVTTAYLDAYNNSSEKVQKAMKEEFDKLDKLNKAYRDNEAAIQAVNDEKDKYVESRQTLAKDLAKQVIEAEKNVAEQVLISQENELKSFKSTHEEIIKGLQDQITALERKNELETESEERAKRLLDIQKAQNTLNNVLNERNTRVYVEGLGWTWQANPNDVRKAQEELQKLQTDYNDWEHQNDIKHQKQKLQDEIDYERALIDQKQKWYDDLKSQFDQQWKNIDDLSQKLLATYGDNIDKAVAELTTKLSELNTQLAGLSAFNATGQTAVIHNSNGKPTVVASGVDAQILRAQYGDSINIVEGKGLAGQPGTDRVSTNQMYQALLGAPKNNISTEQMWGYADGGVNTLTGMHMLHGTPSSAETIFNATDSKKLWDFVHNLPNISTNMMSNLISNFRIPQFTSKFAGLSSSGETYNINGNITIVTNNPTEFFNQLKQRARLV